MGHAYVYVCACMRVYVHVYMYVCVYVCIYIYIHTRVNVNMHSCRRILFICTVQSLYYMRVYHRCFDTCMRVYGGIGCGVGFSLFMVNACFWLGGYVLGGVETGGFVLYIS